MAIEEGQEQRPNMGSIHVGVGHDDDAMITEFLNIVVFFADAGSQRGDENPDLFIGQHLIETGLLNIEDLPFNREDRLDRTIPALLADPPAESPSTMKISLSAGSLSWQSANFPGRESPSRAPFRRLSSLAFRAASLALAASMTWR